MNDQPKYKRRIRLINPSLQVRLIGAFAGVTALALISQALVFGAFVSKMATEMGSAGSQVAEALPGLLARTLGMSAVMVFPALILVGIRVTFRIAGPLYRMERHLDAVASGEHPGPCTIRKKDQLQEFCQTLNRALETQATGHADEPMEAPERTAA